MRKVTILALALAVAVPLAAQEEPAQPSLPERTFERLWKTFDERYALFEAKGIDWGALYGNVGLATAIGSNSMRCTWDPSERPTLLGYSIARSPNGLIGTYVRVNHSLLAAEEYIDAGLQPATTYYYIVYEVDEQLNALQLTPPFMGTTNSWTPVRRWQRYR